MTATEAAQEITAKVKILRKNEALDDDLLGFFSEKLVADILSYCHRDDFPEALVFTAADLIAKRVDDSGGTLIGGTEAKGPLQSVKMDDTEFTFAVKASSTEGVAADADFDTIKPKLNRFRKAVSL